MTENRDCLKVSENTNEYVTLAVAALLCLISEEDLHISVDVTGTSHECIVYYVSGYIAKTLLCKTNSCQWCQEEIATSKEKILLGKRILLASFWIRLTEEVLFSLLQEVAIFSAC